jgi:Glycosyl transferase family 2
VNYLKIGCKSGNSRVMGCSRLKMGVGALPQDKRVLAFILAWTLAHPPLFESSVAKRQILPYLGYSLGCCAAPSVTRQDLLTPFRRLMVWNSATKHPLSSLGAILGAFPSLSIVIPAYNAEHRLSLCLQAFRASTFRDFEVLVVDDCSTDNTEEVIRSHGGRYLRTPRQLGPAAARNLGAERMLAGTLSCLSTLM